MQLHLAAPRSYQVKNELELTAAVNSPESVSFGHDIVGSKVS